MVATVGSISIDLSTNAAKFASGFRSAATTVDRRSQQMAKSIGTVDKASRALSGVVSGFVGGIVAGGALAALTSLTGALGKARQALSDFEEIGNRSKTVGLSTEAFQALSIGALKADVDQEKLNKSLEIFAKNVGLAKEGTGALYSGLLKLNPELLKAVLQAGDQESRLKLVADAMKQTTDATQRAALAQAAFGKGGIDLVRVLDGGAASIEAFKREAAGLGLIVPDELIQKAGELDDKLEILSKVIDLNLSQALVNLAPLLVAGAEGTATFAQNIKALSEALVNFSNTPSIDTFKKLAAAMGIEPKIEGGLLGAIKDSLTRDIPIIKKEIADVEAEIRHLQETGEGGAGIVIEQDIQRLEQLRAELGRVTQAATTAASAAAGVGGVIGAVLASGAFANAVRNPQQSTLSPVTTSGGTDIGTRRNVNGLVTGKTAVDEDVLDDVQDAIDEGTDATKDSGEKINRGLDRLGSGLGDHLSDLADTVNTGTDQIRQLRQDGKTFFNYASLEAAIRTGIVNGLDDSLLGKQFEQSIGNSGYNALFDMLNNRELESDQLQTQLERLKIQADAAGSLAADAFAVKIAQLELKIFDTKQTEATPKTSLLNYGKMSYAGAFADGGSFTVGGTQTGDRNLVSLLANAGEKVTVTPKGQSDRPIVFNYHAAAGESERTARQNARAMYETMTIETSRR